MSDEQPTPTDAEYDAFVATSPMGSIFATSWWLDAATGSEPAERSWQVAVVREEGSIVAAWPTVVSKTRLGTVHTAPPLTPYLGPLLAPVEGSKHQRRSLWNRRVAALVEALGDFAHVEARCSPAFDYWTPLQWAGFSQTTSYTFRIPHGNVDALDVRKNIRGDIRKATGAGVQVAAGEVDELCALSRMTYERQGIGNPLPDQLVRRVYNYATERGRGEVLVARGDDGAAHAAGLFVWDERWTWYLVGGNDPALRSSGASSLLLREAIGAAFARGTGFDFEGSMLPHVERFFRAFGGDPVATSRVRATPSRRYRAATGARRALRVAARRR